MSQTSVASPSRPSLRHALKFERSEWPALFGVLGFVAMLHIVGWGLFIYFNSNPKYHAITDSKGALIYAGAGALAYGFGLRHAFDADHIAAIDDTTRLMLAKGKKPLGVGLFFSLGHSTVVLVLSVVVAFAAKKAVQWQSSFADTGSTIGASVSGFFLYLVGILNLVILVGIIKVWRNAKSGKFSHEHLDQMLNDRGLINVVNGFVRRHLHEQGLFVGIHQPTTKNLLQPHHHHTFHFCGSCNRNDRISECSGRTHLDWCVRTI